MTLEDKALNRIRRYYETLMKRSGFQLGDISKKNYNFEFTAQMGKDKIKAQVYFGKKGVKTVLQGDKETELYRIVNDLLLGQTELTLSAENKDEPETYAGSDESGKGDIFGPLVVCAFLVTPEIKIELRRLGAADSKTLSDYKINSIYEILKKDFSDYYSLKIFEPELYNIKYSETGNLNKLLGAAHLEALYKLSEKQNFEVAIIDKFQKKNLNFKELSLYIDDDEKANRLADSIQVIETTGAERFIGVAAASVCARAKFNEWFLAPERSGFPKGASGEAEKFLRDFLSSHSKSELGKYAKTHFKSISKFR